ncbi:hotdog fold thioesterase [Roseisolibacter sp. H3M3-2]|uniref:hotdog fold thioesterase n=1 Tax=Roseisolibacter sp. H3M3-2 TaxID=3031323 RepID=UPI0023DADD70|nr:hotdog fold thioesterase [Roseisolibacter sp. H3M3-2]MDF1503505.1 hotdog fold thioesterase [Roseisolibacter sp. H3M3-2]
MTPEVRAWLSAFPHLGLLETLGIALTDASAERVVGTMPVGRAVHQPFGLLHGGASVALAESVASIGATLACDHAREMAVGLEINANHVRSVRDGVVTAVATPLHVGRSTQVWDVRITDERDRLVCVSRCTLAVVPRQRDAAQRDAAQRAG